MRRKPQRSTKFDECRDCQFNRRPDICAECDNGEQFEERDDDSLNFEPNAAFVRTRRPLVSEDDEPNFNPDDLIHKIDLQEEDKEDDRFQDDDDE